MIREISTITQTEVAENGVCSAPDFLTGTPEENKRVFDRLATEIIIPRLNALITEAKKLESTATETSEKSDELSEIIKNTNDLIGEIQSVEVSGDTLAEKIKNLRDAILNDIVETSKKIGSFARLKFESNSVVNALNYLYELSSPGSINMVNKLPEACADNLMKIFRTFDLETLQEKFYVCKSKTCKEKSVAVGDVIGEIYFDPYLTKERVASFCAEHMDEFRAINDTRQVLDLAEFVDGDGVVSYLRMLYVYALESYALLVVKGENEVILWSSDNFILGDTHFETGFHNGAKTELFAECTVSAINYELPWMYGKEYFESEYYWEELGASTVEVDAERQGNCTALIINSGDERKTVSIYDGEDGYTPKKGTDYFTEGEIEEITSSIEESVRKDLPELASISPEFAESVDECIDNKKMYVLPDGFVYAYMKKHIVNISDEFDLNKGAALNVRIDSSGNEVAYNGIALSGLVEVTPQDPYTVKISGVTIVDVYAMGVFASAYDENKSYLGKSVKYVSQLTPENGVYTIDLNEMLFGKFSGVKYVKIGVGIKKDSELSESDVENLKICFEPLNVDETVYGFYNTNHAFVPADYEDVISDLSERVENNEEEISRLEKTFENGVAYPSVWNESLERVASLIKEKQDEAGIDSVTFAYFSDNHQRLGDVGALASYLMEKCNIPFIFFCGDSIDSGYINSDLLLENQEQKFYDMMKDVPKEKFLRAIGNHDGYYMTSEGKKFHFPWERKYSLFLRPLSACGLSFGGDGTYYFLDHNQSKTRFIVLNSVWFNHKTNADGTVNNSDLLGFGNEQINWLKEVLLSTPSGFDVAFVAHSPISNYGHSNIRDAHVVQGLINAFVDGTAYSGSYNDAVDEENNCSVSVAFSEKHNVIGWFSGHVHLDEIFTADAKTSAPLSFKCVTITSDANLSYDDNEPVRDMEGDTSHAVDFVTVNKKKGEAYAFRLGVGSDRSWTYGEE